MTTNKVFSTAATSPFAPVASKDHNYAGLSPAHQYTAFDIPASITHLVGPGEAANGTKTTLEISPEILVNGQRPVHISFDLRCGTFDDAEFYGLPDPSVSGEITCTFESGVDLTFRLYTKPNGEPSVALYPEKLVGFALTQYAPEQRLRDLVGLIKSLGRGSPPRPQLED